MEVREYTCKAGKYSFSILNLGCAVTSICTPDRDGNIADVTLPYKGAVQDPSVILNSTSYRGLTVGRFANRIGGARFKVGGREFVFDNKIDPCGLGVVVDEVDLSEVEAFHNFLLRSVIVAEHPGVHQQSTACRRIEPSQIEDRLGLTSSHKVPFTVGPSLDPGVVVVRMGPAGSVDLPCWNAN